MQVVNGYVQEKLPVDEKPAPSPDQGFEEDVSDTGMLAKLGIVVTIILVLSVVGVKLYFDSALKEELNTKEYTYSKRAVAPSYRTNE